MFAPNQFKNGFIHFSFLVDIALSETILEYMYARVSESELIFSLLLCCVQHPSSVSVSEMLTLKSSGSWSP